MPKNDKSMYISLAFMPVAPVQNVSIASRAYMIGSGTSIEAEQQKARKKKKFKPLLQRQLRLLQ
jgi:hypothetical protein